MSVLNLVLYPDEPLLKVAAPYASVGPDMLDLARDLFETMEAHEGVGLAGPQVGISKRIFVMRPPDGNPRCVINPEILYREGSEVGEEGCLSMPRIYGNVPRATLVRLRYLDETGRPHELDLHDFEARIVQHEFDHLEGILFIDHFDILSKQAALQEWNEVKGQLLDASARS